MVTKFQFGPRPELFHPEISSVRGKGKIALSITSKYGKIHIELRRNYLNGETIEVRHGFQDFLRFQNCQILSSDTLLLVTFCVTF